MRETTELARLIDLLEAGTLGAVLGVGTAFGAMLDVWCQVAEPDATIVSVGLPVGPHPSGVQPGGAGRIRSLARAGQSLHLLQMDPGRAGARQAVLEILGGRRLDLLSIDGDHSYYGALAAFREYAPLVREGGMIVLHGILPADDPQGAEVSQLWERVKALYEWTEVAHDGPERGQGGFGALTWSRRPSWEALEALPRPSPSAGRDGPPSLQAGSPCVAAAETIVGTLLVDRRDRRFAGRMMASGVRDIAQTRYLMDTLRQGHTFVDVGAHVGYFTLLGAIAVGPAGRVVAVEPDEGRRALLRRNVVRNGVRTVDVVPFAAGSRRGWGNGATSDARGRDDAELMPSRALGTSVRRVRLDDVLPGKVDLVRIGTRRAGADAVRGLQRTLASNPDVKVVCPLPAGTGEGARPRLDAAISQVVAMGFRTSLVDELGGAKEVAPETLGRLARSDPDARITVVLDHPEHALPSGPPR